MKAILLRIGALIVLFNLTTMHAIAAPLPTFTKITSGPVASAGSSSSLAWGDYNNDGFVDLYVNVLNGGMSLLYSNNGNGTFTRVMTGNIATDPGTAFGAAWADYDNDGALDLFVAVNSSGSDWLYHNNGNGSFTKITAGAIVSSGGNGNNCSWGDYDNDGFVDLFVANSDQRDFLYHNNGDSTFTRITNGPIAEKAGNSQGGTWGDYDNDGRLDLFVSRVNEPNLLYHNEGNGVFRTITNGIMVTEQAASQGTSWGDYDNDGYLDMFVANPINGLKNFLYHNNGDGSFSKITTGPVVADTFGSCGVWADYDNDGFLDLFIANRSIRNSLFHNNGDGTFTKITDVVPAIDPNNSFSAAWADYDNDGFPDLFVSNVGTYNNFLYHNDGNANNWLTIKCEGRISNRAAIGAKVRLRATIGGRSMWQLREISGGGGLGSQNDLRAQFGLGDATTAERVRIEWPSGIVQELSNVDAKQFLTIIEPELSISPKEQQPSPGDTATFTFITTMDPPFTLQWELNGRDVPDATSPILIISNVKSEDGGSYTVRLTTADGLVLHSPAARLTGPVFFAQQPQSQNVRGTSNATFQVVATGSAPFTYQWQRNGTDIPGATQSTLTLSNVQLSDSADYRVLVSNAFGPAVSAPARLIVLLRPVIIEQPQSRTIIAGEDVTFTVSASGTLPMNFSWRFNSATVTNMLLNQTNCSFILRQVRTNQAGNYAVGITNLAGQAIRLSSNAVLTVLGDTDGDHIPDQWEIAHGLDITDPLDAALDNDGDGLTNLQEYLAGTDPNDAESCLRITSVRAALDAILLQFDAVSNQSYRVEFLNDSSSWTRLSDVAAAPTNRIVMVEDATSPDRLRLYRLKVQH